MDKEGKYTMDVYSIITNSSNSFYAAHLPGSGAKIWLALNSQIKVNQGFGQQKVKLSRAQCNFTKEYSGSPGRLCPWRRDVLNTTNLWSGDVEREKG